MQQHSALYQSFQSAYAPKTPDDSGDSFFDDARHGLMKDLVDFSNRDDFDSYMRTIEKNYYQKLNFPQPPYEQLPAFPPKPYPQAKKKRHQHDEQRDFIDKVNEINQKRVQAYHYPTPEQIQQQERQQYMQSLSHKSINPHQTPFFETMNNKENPLHYHSGYNMSQQFPLPQHKAVPPPYMQKFVAGPTRLESNPLSEPTRNFKTQTPSVQQIPQLADYDLKNPDVQYERYRHLMTNQFYNNHANSLNLGFNMNAHHTVYHPPAPYTQVHIPVAQHQPDMYQQSFNPHSKGMPQAGHIFPQTQHLYHKIPDSIALYSQPGGPPPGFVDPNTYRRMKDNNVVDKNIIESIGGIEDTLKPLQETLKQHELRPFQIQKDFKQDYMNSSKGRDLKRSLSEHKPEQMRLVSVSPYRAVVKFDQQDNDNTLNDSSDDEEHDVTRHPGYPNMNATNDQRNSSIGPDSQNLRGTREQFLNSFNEKRNQSMNDSDEQKNVKEHQKIRMESEFLRQQREQFLNSFSQPSMSTHARPQMHISIPQ